MKENIKERIYRYYDPSGKPYPGKTYIEQARAWARDFESEKLRQVAKTFIPGGFVSTVWMGMDESFFGDGPPLIYETMVFLDDKKWVGQDMAHHSTREQAIAGHKRMVRKWMRKVIKRTGGSK